MKIRRHYYREPAQKNSRFISTENLISQHKLRKPPKIRVRQHIDLVARFQLCAQTSEPKSWLSVYRFERNGGSKQKSLLQIHKSLSPLKRTLKLSLISNRDFGKMNSELQCSCSGPTVKAAMLYALTFSSCCCKS